ncbi:UNVERIFIED_ORG: EAL domain-containing protein [Burkholderia sp. CF145]|uniref:EAL domain-containing protein n=1 Tax=Paraburkholderia hospita TaxID=169430 RepID=UPI00027168DA|nr:EAL domain-containing protein [Paraburkholderia hospita]EUC11634.1 diguanylate phosphodiesterase [Burkholderia sp. BT03]SKD07626.1 EAL domain-containing protein [Paraburkholderia hospita]
MNLLIAAGYLIVFAPRRLLLSAVRRALRHGQLHIAYQPVVEIATRRMTGVEALIRWTHPKWGAVSPSAFMTEVESSSLLASVTRFALQRATEGITQKTDIRPLRVVVNIAPMDLERKEFVADARSAAQPGHPVRSRLFLPAPRARLATLRRYQPQPAHDENTRHALSISGVTRALHVQRPRSLKLG